MFTRRRVVHYCIALACMALFGYWMYSNIRDGFVSLQSGQRAATVASLAESFPGEGGEEAAEEWLRRVAKQSGNYTVLHIAGVPLPDEHLPASGDAFLAALYAEQGGNADFARAFDHVAYDEMYVSPVTVSRNASPHVLVFTPLRGGESTLLVLFDLAGQNGFLHLVRLLFLAAFAAGAVVLGLFRFTRDPLVGFSVSALFLMALVFIAYPLAEALRLSFVRDGQFSLEIWRSILASRGNRAALWGSIELGLWTASVSTVIGFIFAFVCTRTRVPGKKAIAALGTLPVISPPFSLTLSIILLFGNNGLFTQMMGFSQSPIYGLLGLVAAQTMGMFPIAFLTLSGVLDAIDSTFEEAALNLSASRWKTFTSVTVPLAVPGFLSAWLLVFINSLADFANPLILAGNYRVLSLEAYLEVTGMNRLGHGAALSILLLLPTLTAFLVQRFWVARKSYVTVTGKPSGRITELTSPGVKGALLVFIGLVAALLICLYGTIVAGCFVKNWGIDYTFSLENITEGLTRGKDALKDTVLLAGAATPVAGILAMLAALLIVRKTFYGKRALEVLLMTPFALPGTLVGISFILAFNTPPLILVGTAFIIIINYVVRELPVGIEGGIASLHQIDPSIEEAATDLGADSATVFRTIVLPLLRPAFISSLSYTFVRSMTAVSAVIFLISARWYHLTVLIYNFSENLRFGLASVLSTTLIIIVFAVFGLMRLLVRKNDNLVKSINA